MWSIILAKTPCLGLKERVREVLVGEWEGTVVVVGPHTTQFLWAHMALSHDFLDALPR